MTHVLVTGGNGFVASWTIYKLLQRGYAVKTTVRRKESAETLYKMLEELNVETEHFSYATIDMTQENGWDEVMQGMAKIVKENCGQSGKKVKTGTMPTWVVKFLSKFIKDFEAFLPLLITYPMTNEKAKTILGWQPRLAKDTVIDTANYLIENNFI